MNSYGSVVTTVHVFDPTNININFNAYSLQEALVGVVVIVQNNCFYVLGGYISSYVYTHAIEYLCLDINNFNVIYYCFLQ